MFVILSVKVTRLGKMNTDVVLDLLANIRHSVAMTLCDIMTCISIRSCIPFFPKDLVCLFKVWYKNMNAVCNLINKQQYNFLS